MKNRIKEFLKKKLHMPYLLRKQQILGDIYSRNPQRRADRLFFHYFHRHINWDNPTNFFEKIRYIQFRTDTSLWPELADKCLAREYVANKGCGELLIPCYGIWDKVNDIDFKSLPDSFVIKPNNGSGDVIIVTDKQNADIRLIKRKLSYAMTHKYGGYMAETHYRYIKPRILAEMLLPNDSGFSSSIVDYKFYCIHGIPRLCVVLYDRTDFLAHTIKYAIFDMDWNRRTDWEAESIYHEKKIPQPASFTRMLEFCQVLTQGIPFVRLDFYEYKGVPYFGEFTFTPIALKPLVCNQNANDYLSSFLHI